MRIELGLRFSGFFFLGSALWNHKTFGFNALCESWMNWNYEMVIHSNFTLGTLSNVI